MENKILCLVLLSLGVAVKSQTDSCTSPLGMEDGTITDSQLSSSSAAPGFSASEGRLNNDNYCWSAAAAELNQWIQVDLGVSKQVTGVVTQGWGNKHVSSYKVHYSVDESSFAEVNDTNGNIAFSGNEVGEENTPVENSFLAPVTAQFIRIYPLSWVSHPSMRMEFLGCEGETSGMTTGHTTSGMTTGQPSGMTTGHTTSDSCTSPLGMEVGTITDSQLSSSGNRDHFPASSGRLNGENCWSAQNLEEYQWIQVDLGVSKQVTGVVTQGWDTEHVSSYQVGFSVDGRPFTEISDTNGDFFYSGNKPAEEEIPVTNLFASPVNAQFIRIYPVTWGGWPSMRMEVLGCKVCNPECLNGGECMHASCLCPYGFVGPTCKRIVGYCPCE